MMEKKKNNTGAPCSPTSTGREGTKGGTETDMR